MTTTIERDALHVRTWPGTGSVRITDMANAGKRGKECRVLRFQGWRPGPSTGGVAAQATQLCVDVEVWTRDMLPGLSFDEAETQLRAIVAMAALPAHCGSVNVETIRGIDAPRTVLSAGIDGKWTLRVNEDGVLLTEDNDKYNDPAWCTHNQSGPRAYEIARKVWHEVGLCETASQVARVLGDAGCRLHYWCRVD